MITERGRTTGAGADAARVVEASAGTRARARRARRGVKVGSSARAAVLFLAPFLVFYGALKLWPIAYGFWISLHRWETIGTSVRFVGLENYERIAQDRLFHDALEHTLVFTGIAAPALIGLGLVLALVLDRIAFGRGIFRPLLYLPNVLSTAVIGLIFLAVLAGDERGLVNHVLSRFGIEPVPFLLNAGTAMPSIALAALWWTVGFNMLILLAGLQNIPDEVLDAARVDGASGWAMLARITLPLLRRPLMLVTILQVIACFQVFSLIDVMTRGGPGGATRSLVYYILERAFTHGQLGYGAAVGFVLFALLFLLSVTQLRLFRRSGDAV
jgi:multiple sugar transport system permease protein